jgi:hypothetical protein
MRQSKLDAEPIRQRSSPACAYPVNARSGAPFLTVFIALTP